MDKLRIKKYVSSSSIQDDQYQVFLNFRGKDTRKGFTDFLFTFLVDVGKIRTFKDDKSLRTGMDIGSDLRRVIARSEILIPIFSRTYADSLWCLRELVEMVNEWQKDNKGKIIMPIFYDVKPSEVREQSGNFQKAFDQHMENHSEQEVKEWRQALELVSKLKGWELETEANGYQGKLVKLIFEGVHEVLYKDHMLVQNHEFGQYAHHVRRVRRLLDIGNNDCVTVLGIYGKYGIGKSPTVKITFNNLFKEYEGFAFLEEVKDKDTVHLQKQLIDSVLGENSSLEVTSVRTGMNMIIAEFVKKRVFIVIDHVLHASQLKALVGSCDWFGPGSRIIITTHDKAILTGIATVFYDFEKQ